MNQKTFVRHHRRRWKLTPAELAQLVGTSHEIISRCEAVVSRIDLEVALGLQVVLGLSPRALFPRLYRRVEDAVMRRAAEFEDSIRGRHDHIAKRQRRLLAAMTLRATNNPPAAA